MGLCSSVNICCAIGGAADVAITLAISCSAVGCLDARTVEHACGSEGTRISALFDGFSVIID